MNLVSMLMHHQSTESKFILCKQQTLVHTAMQNTIQKWMLILGAGNWSCFFNYFFASSMVHPVFSFVIFPQT